MYCGKCGCETPSGMEYCPACQLQIDAQTRQPESQVVNMPMKWYSFLVYFSLFLSMIINIISGIGTMTGNQYLGYTAEVYGTFPAMKYLDIAMGIYSIAFGLLALVVRTHLVRFSKKAISLVTLFYSLPIISSILYAAASSFVLGQNCFTASIIAPIIGQIIMLVCNIIYFKKRSHLFVN